MSIIGEWQIYQFSGLQQMRNFTAFCPLFSKGSCAARQEVISFTGYVPTMPKVSVFLYCLASTKYVYSLIAAIPPDQH
ncbi:MAG: hypothetical protein LUG15_00745, partial [Oscillospiraceae bacterium]|nr:hypothetical protein [Oscillospiraceae bacterium]